MIKSVKLNIAIAILVLSGCAATPTPSSKFDPILYNSVIDLQMMNVASGDVCDSGSIRVGMIVRDLRFRAEALVKYTTHTSRDANVLMKEVHKSYVDMGSAFSAGSPPPTYCRVRLAATYKLLDKVIELLGTK